MLILSDEHHSVTSSTVLGPVKKSSLSKGLCFCERYAEGSGVRNGAKLSGWTVDSREFRKIDWVTFNERIVAQSYDFILDS